MRVPRARLPGSVGTGVGGARRTLPSGSRRVWFQYWDTQLTYQKSYFARLSYVHRNAVHHKLVLVPSLYPWCSASWLQRTAPRSFYKTIMTYGIERIKVPDDFEVEWLPDA